jgi:hypothetical protein
VDPAEVVEERRRRLALGWGLVSLGAGLALLLLLLGGARADAALVLFGAPLLLVAVGAVHLARTYRSPGT